MAIETFPFDASEYLDTEDDQLELLQDAMATGNAASIATALGIVARARGTTQIAKDAGVTREALTRL